MLVVCALWEMGQQQRGKLQLVQMLSVRGTHVPIFLWGYFTGLIKQVWGLCLTPQETALSV